MIAGARPAKPRPGRSGHPRGRLAAIWVTALIASVALVVRLVSLQVSPSDALLHEGERQRIKTISLQATRGSITDRNGADLAISVPQTTIAADSTKVADPMGDAALLAPILGRDAAEIQALLSSGRTFVYLARQVDAATAKAVAALKLGYVWTYSELKRFLPAGDGLGVSVIGRTDIDSDGLSGLELQYNELLRGQDGRLIIEQGTAGRTIPGGEQQLSAASPGWNLVLSLDQGLQFEAETLLRNAVDEAGAKGGMVIVSRVETGEILVSANVVREGGGPARVVADNRAVTWTYEPGSTNKLLTMAGVVEEGLARPGTVRSIAGHHQVASKRWVQEGRPAAGDLSLTDIFKASDNIGTMVWAQDLGAEKMHGYLRAFGFGETTALDFPNESRGLLPELARWSALSLPTIAIGQGVAVTPMQMLVAYNTIANKGVRVAPRLVLGTESPNGTFVAADVPAPVRVVSESTAAALTQMLAVAVEDGTGRRAQVPGFTVAGKTGTAWKALPTGGYADAAGRHRLVTSFFGFLPAASPELSIAVVLDEPADARSTGGGLSAPLFRDVASYAVRHLRIAPDASGEAPAPGERVRASPQPLAPTLEVAARTPTTTTAATAR